MSVRNDFECNAGHEFILWSDDARLCPVCGSEYLKKVFLTAPAVNEKAGRIDQMIKHELDARGITNLQTQGREGDKAKITYKTAPETLAAEKIERDFPQMKDRGALAAAEQAAKTKWGNLTVKSVVGAGGGGNALAGMFPVGTQQRNGKTYAIPSTEPNQFKLNDSKMVQRVVRKDPENLQVKEIILMDSATITTLASLAINGLIGFGMAWVAYKTKSLDNKASHIINKVEDVAVNTNSKFDKLIASNAASKEAESTAKQHAASLEGEMRGRDLVAPVAPVVIAEKAAVYELTQQDITEFKTLIERMTAKKNG